MAKDTHQNQVNPLLEYFYADPTNKRLLEKKQQEDQHAADLLDKRFEVYYLKVRLISYSDKLAKYLGKNFDKKERKQHKQLHLDSFTGLESDDPPVQQLPSREPPVIDCLTERIVDILPTQRMKETYINMSDEKKEVLQLFTFEQLNNKEIAERINCSPQNVSKLKIKALNELRGVEADERKEERSVRRSPDGNGSAN